MRKKCCFSQAKSMRTLRLQTLAVAPTSRFLLQLDLTRSNLKNKVKMGRNCQDMSRIVKIRLWWFLWWSSTIFFCTEEKYYHEPWTPWTSFLLVLAKTNRFRSIWFGHGKLRVFWLSTIFASASTLSLGLSRRAWQRPVKWTCWSSAVEQLCTWAWLWAQTIEVTSGC